MADSTHHLDWDERLQDWIDGDLAPSDSASLEAHVAGCALCQTRANALRALDTTLLDTLSREALSADFDRSLLGHIDLVPRPDRAAARARIEQAWQAEAGAFSRQWRTSLRSMILNALLAAGLLTAFLTRLPGWVSGARLSDQIGQITLLAFGRPALTLVAMAGGMSIIAFALTRVFGERP